jgi:glycosyltransferase involved in cell wall biosynthesis
VTERRDDVGVVMPTHPARWGNGMVRRALDSVGIQTYPAAAVSIYNDVDRRGASYARQKALEGNTRTWTAFLDSDDWFAPQHLAVLMEAARETEADYIYSWYHLVAGGRVLDHDPVFPETHFTAPWDDADPRQTTITMLVRTDLAREVGFWDMSDETTFPDGLRVGEDWHFTLGCLKLGAKIHHVMQRTWYWEHHGANTSGRPGHGDAQ